MRGAPRGSSNVTKSPNVHVAIWLLITGYCIGYDRQAEGPTGIVTKRKGKTNRRGSCYIGIRCYKVYSIIDFNIGYTVGQHHPG